MKISKWIAFAMIAVLVTAMMAAITYTTFAQGSGTDGNDTSESPQDNGVALQGQTAITQEEAEAIALALHPGAKVSATELENEGGTLLYSIELDNDAEVELDANTGTVLPEESETGADSNN